MKKKLLPLLFLFPLGVFAQDVKPDSAASEPLKWEVGLNTALAFIADNDVIYDDIFLAGRNSFSVYRNFSGAQIGLLVEGGLMGGGDSWWISPQAVVNYRIRFKKLYAYGGGAAGYVREQYTDGLHGSAMNGFVTGVQAGAVYNLGKRFGLNVEGGVRFKHMYTNVKIYNDNFGVGPSYTTTEVRGHTDIYFPVSVGVRYKF
jgi:hypothetical protein